MLIKATKGNCIPLQPQGRKIKTFQIKIMIPQSLDRIQDYIIKIAT